MYISTFFFCVASGFIPVMNAEVYLTSISALLLKSNVVFIALISSFAQMLAKSVIYFGARGILILPLKKNGLDKVKRKFERRKHSTSTFILVSASFGLPPFYIVSILAGIVKINFWLFFLCGFIGRFLRFTVILMFPQLIKLL